MKPIYDAWLIQIEVTNACNIGCANCTRCVGHHRKIYFMDLKTIEKAIDSLDGYKGGIGIMGGEPTLHPKFEEICKLIQEKGITEKCGLWTSGYKWDKYKEIIRKTFGLGVYYNDHSDRRQKHQPILVGIKEVIKDEKLMWELIENCWIQKYWSPSINPKGAFFCEVAAALDLVFEGPGGYPIEKGWWKKTPEEFRDQVERYCPMCGGALPFDCPSNKEEFDLISPENYKRLLKLKSPKVLANRVKIFDTTFTTKEIKSMLSRWCPWEYLAGGIRKRDLKPDEIPILNDLSFIEIFKSFVNYPKEFFVSYFRYPKKMSYRIFEGIRCEGKKVKLFIKGWIR